MGCIGVIFRYSAASECASSSFAGASLGDIGSPIASLSQPYDSATPPSIYVPALRGFERSIMHRILPTHPSLSDRDTASEH